MLRYPKLLLLLATCLLAFFLVESGLLDWMHGITGTLGYISVFLAGVGYSFTLTTAFSIGAFVELSHQVHPLLGGLIAGTGALLGDLLIFTFIRFSIHEEIQDLMQVVSTSVRQLMHQPTWFERIKPALLWIVAGLIIGSPLPDELGIALLGHAGRIHPRLFVLLCFTFNTLSATAILATARALS